MEYEVGKLVTLNGAILVDIDGYKDDTADRAAEETEATGSKNRSQLIEPQISS